MNMQSCPGGSAWLLRLMTWALVPLTAGACAGTTNPAAGADTGTDTVADVTPLDATQTDTVAPDTSASDAAGDATSAVSPKLMFAQAIPAASSAKLVAVGMDAAGNVWIAGMFKGSLVLGEVTLASQAKAGDDLFIAKLLPTGKTAWAKAYGGISDDKLFALAVAPDGRALFGASGQEVDLGAGKMSVNFLAMLDTDGKLIWSQSPGKGAARFDHLRFTQNGSFVATGLLSAAADLGGGALAFKGYVDAFVARFDAAGKHVWSRSLGNADDSDAIRDFGLTGLDEVVMTGELGPDGAKLGEFVISKGDQVLFLAKLDAQGQPMWAKNFPTQKETHLAVLADGTFFVAATAKGIQLGSDITYPTLSKTASKSFVAKFNADGKVAGIILFGSTAQYSIDQMAAMEICGADVVVAGAIQSPITLGGPELPFSGGLDSYVLRLDTSLKPIDALALGSGKNTSAAVASFACNAMGQAAFGGNWASTAAPATLTWGGVSLSLPGPGMAMILAAFAP